LDELEEKVMNKETLRKYFSKNLVRKLVAFVLLLSFSANIFAEAVPELD
jgi:hypothetical protein